MITLLAEPQLEMEGRVSRLVLWVCDAFDEEYSFRTLLAKITASLERKGGVELTLPPEEPLEDFVHGALRCGPLEHEVYFERSLGYLQFSSTAESGGRDLLDSLMQDLVWSSDTGNSSG